MAQLSRNPTEAATADGVTSTVCGNTLVVFGGWDADRIWQLDLPTAVWTEVLCGGDIPYPRLHHSSSFYKGALLMTGGERLQPAGPQEKPAYTLGYHELDLESYDWMSVECFGIMPRARSHHTVEVLDDSLYVCGGKPLTDRTLSAAALSEEKRNGFFDLFVLHIQSRTWRRVEMYDPTSPMLWGHTCSSFRGSFLLFFGGFDVSTHTASFVPSGLPGEGAPVAELSNVVHILKLDTMTWMRYTPQKGEAAPVPRVGHTEYCHGAECIIFGGMTLDHAGRALNVNDCWVWSIESGRWSRLEFCIPSWPSKRLISGMHGSQFVIAPSLRDLFFLNLGKRGVGWQRVSTTTSRPIVKEGILSSAPVLMDQAGGTQEGELNPRPSADSEPRQTPYEADVSNLQTEVATLKAQLAASELKRQQVKEQMAAQPKDEGVKKPVIMAHWADVAPIKTHPLQYSDLHKKEIEAQQVADRPERPAWEGGTEGRSGSGDNGTPIGGVGQHFRSTSLDSMSSIEYFQHLRKQRSNIADNRKDKIAALQSRLAGLEKNSFERSQKVELVRAIREETKQLESAVAEQEKPTVQRVAEAVSPRVTAYLHEEQQAVTHPPPPPRTREEEATPLLYQQQHNPTRRGETLFSGGDRSRKREPQSEPQPTASQTATTRDAEVGGGLHGYRSGSGRAPSPVKTYWDQLDQVMQQPPAVRM